MESNLDRLLVAKRDAIARLARRYGVVRLEAFGSVTGGDFRPDSDIDLLVDFEPSRPVEHAERYFALQEALEELLGRPVDLVELAPIRNPYFLKAIEPSRVVLYAA